MSDISRLIYSFPPEKRSAVSDAAYERQIREYVKAVERLSSDVFVSGAGGGEDMLEVCALFFFIIFNCEFCDSCFFFSSNLTWLDFFK